MKAPLPVYKNGAEYDITAGIRYPIQKADHLVYHSHNLPFIWSEITDEAPKQQAVAKGMRAYYASFILTGNVNSELTKDLGLPDWPATDTPKVMDINLDEDPTKIFVMTTDTEGEKRCNYWANLFDDGWFVTCLPPPIDAPNDAATCPKARA